MELARKKGFQKLELVENDRFWSLMADWARAPEGSRSILCQRAISKVHR